MKKKLIIDFFYSLFIYCLYTVFYLDERDQSDEDSDEPYGYYVKKRIWVFVIISPLLIPVFVFRAVINYADWVTTWYVHRVVMEKRKLTLKQKISIAKRLTK